MRKLLHSLLAGLLICLSACTKEEAAFDFDGFKSVEDYMVYLSDGFVTKHLDILETMLDNPAQEINRPGAELVLQEGEFSGAVVSCNKENWWHILFENNLRLGSRSCPTTYTLDVERYQKEDGGYAYRVYNNLSRTTDDKIFVRFHNVQFPGEYTRKSKSLDWQVYATNSLRVYTEGSGTVNFQVKDKVITFLGRDYQF